MHYLQKHILDTLRYHGPTRYTDLLPPGTESSHARYHLRQMEKAGYVAKDIDLHTYSLTAAGKTQVDYLSHGRVTTVRTPKVITYTLLKHGDQLLLYVKDKEPYRGMAGLIGGKMHFGESLEAASIREIREKTGLHIQHAEYCGTADICLSEDGQPLTHVTAHLFVAELAALPVPLPNRLIATTLQELAGIVHIPDTADVIEAIMSPRPCAVSIRHSL